METALAKKTGEPDVAPGRVEGGADLGARVAKVKGETSNIELRMRTSWYGGLKNTWSNRKELKEHIEKEFTGSSLCDLCDLCG
jgi:hypothetical protein